MKKTVITFAAVVASSIIAYSQDVKVQEPEFVGQAFLLKQDATTEILEKTPAKSTMKAKISLFNGGYSQVVSLDGCCSAVKAEPVNGVIKLIVRVADNKLDPTDVIQVVQFEKSKRERKAETMSFSALKGADMGGKIKRATFYGKKYGESSYILNVSVPGTGEYGIFIQENGQPVKFVSTFSVM